MSFVFVFNISLWVYIDFHSNTVITAYTYNSEPSELNYNKISLTSHIQSLLSCKYQSCLYCIICCFCKCSTQLFFSYSHAFVFHVIPQLSFFSAQTSITTESHFIKGNKTSTTQQTCVLQIPSLLAGVTFRMVLIQVPVEELTRTPQSELWRCLALVLHLSLNEAQKSCGAQHFLQVKKGRVNWIHSY